MRRAALIATAFTVASNVSADIVDNGKFTTDTESGLDWLDLSETLDRSPNQILESMAPGGDLVGWRYSTLEEVNSFVENALGVPVDGWAPTTTDIMAPLMDMIGVTEIAPHDEEPGNIIFSVGVYETSTGFEKAQFTQYDFNGFAFYAYGLPWNAEDANESIGSLLVRERPVVTYTCTGFLSPADKIIAMKSGGRIVPLKMTLDDADGFPVTSIQPPRLKIKYMPEDQCSQPSPREVTASSVNGTGDAFYFNGSHWEFRLETKEFAPGSYSMEVVSGSLEYGVLNACSATLHVN